MDEHGKAIPPAASQPTPEAPSGSGERPLPTAGATGVAMRFTLAGVIVAVALALVLQPAMRGNAMASGADTGSYLFTTKYLTDTLLAKGRLPNINPYWYGGFEVLHNTPLLVYVPLGAIYFATKDIIATGRAAHYLFYIAIGLAALLVLLRRHTALSSLVGAILFAACPIVLDQIALGGSYPRAMAISIGVLTGYFVDELIERGPTAKTVAWMCALVSASFLAHPVTGAAFLICWSVYYFARLAFEKRLAFARLFNWVGIMILGVAFTAWYLVPFLVEQTGWTVFPEEIYQMYSIGFRTQLSWLGWPLLLAAAIGLAVTRREPVSRGLAVAGAAAMVLAGGIYTMIHRLVPALESIYPFVFLFFVAYVMAYLAADGVEFAIRDRRLSVTLVSLVAVVAIGGSVYGARDYSALGGKIAPKFRSATDMAVASHLKASPNPGRVMPMKYPFTYLLWWIMSTSDKPMVEGWYYSLTQLGKHIAWVYDAVDHGFPDYAVAVLRRLNVRYLVTNNNFAGKKYGAFLKAMKRDGFRETGSWYRNKVYALDVASGYVMPVTAKTLVVGTYGANVAPLIPNSIMAGSPYLDDYTEQDLRQYDALVLYGFGCRDRARAEKLVTGFVRRGGRVLVDLLGMQKSMIEENPTFLGVTGYPRVSRRAIHLEMMPGAAGGTATDAPGGSATDAPGGSPTDSPGAPATDLPRVLLLPSADDGGRGAPREWRYTTYLGLSRAVAKERGDPTFALMGEKAVDGGSVLFVGANLFYHAYLTGNQREIAFIRDRAGVAAAPAGAMSGQESPTGDAPVAAGAQPAPADSAVRIDGGRALSRERVRFRYDSPASTALLVSYAYSPHWRAFVDGKPLPVKNLDDLIALTVPGGSHTVQLVYSETSIHYLAWAVSLLALIALGAFYIREKNMERGMVAQP